MVKIEKSLIEIDKIKQDYILNHFIRMYSSLDISDLDIGYDESNKIQIASSSLSLLEPLEIKNNVSWNGTHIPVFYENPPKEALCFSGDRAQINFDLFKNAFLFLSGIIDLHFNENRDNIGRYLYAGSFHDKHDLLKIPVVNYYFEILKEAIECSYNIKLTPKFGKLKVSLTHDIDKCMSGWLEDGFFLLKKGRILDFIRVQFNKFLFGKDTWFNFKEILEKEKSQNIKSTFYFLTKKGKVGKYYNADYKYNSKKLVEVYDNIIQSGSEVGLHGSFGSSFSTEQFNEELMRLNNVLPNAPVNGNRFHFLCWNQNNTPLIIEESKLLYDMSAAYPDSFGFKTNFCFPSRFFDFKNNSPFNYVVVPLMLMDSTVLGSKYLGLDSISALNSIITLIKECEKFNGIFTLLWHNTFYTNHKYKGNEDLLNSILEYCKEHNAEFDTVQRISEQWI